MGAPARAAAPARSGLARAVRRPGRVRLRLPATRDLRATRSPRPSLLEVPRTVAGPRPRSAGPRHHRAGGAAGHEGATIDDAALDDATPGDAAPVHEGAVGDGGMARSGGVPGLDRAPG